MAADDLKVGQRVKIRRDQSYGPGPWPDEPTGEVRLHPHAESGAVSVPTQTTLGQRRTYWIVFDVPQFNVDGDGPYLSSEVLDLYLDPEP